MKDIRIIISRIYKSTELNRHVNIIDFGLNDKEAVSVTYYTPLRSIILRIKDIK